MNHLTDKSNELDIIIERLNKDKIFFSIELSGDKIIYLDTEDIELITYAKKNNQNLKESIH